MDTYLQTGLDALADVTRMAIIQKLSSGPMAVHELARVLPITRPAVSQHLKILKEAGLVRDHKSGTRRLYQLDAEGVARLRLHFDDMWGRALARFEQAVDRSTQDEKHDKHVRKRAKG